MLTMPSECRTALIAALRSGRYKQSLKYMRTANDEYDILGVALDIMGFTEWGSIDKDGVYVPHFDARERVIESIRLWPVLEAMYDAGLTEASFPQLADWLTDNTAPA